MARLIDADALERSFRDVMEPDVPTYLNVITGMIKAMPTVDAKPVRQGRWIAHPTELHWDVCSVCGTGCKRREDDNGAVAQYNYHYCPWCGAKMDGGGT